MKYDHLVTSHAYLTHKVTSSVMFCGLNLPVIVSTANLPTLSCGAFKRLVYAISRLSISRINCQLFDVRIGDEDNANAKESTENTKTKRGKS